MTVMTVKFRQLEMTTGPEVSLNGDESIK